MADKDLLEIISEMLRKQDRHSELLGGLGNGLEVLGAKIDGVSERLESTNSILKDFMSVSIKQWEEQQKFNERLYTRVEGIEKHLEKIADLEDRVKRIENILFKAS
jgi:methyl-accepting chemotaxis protein